MQDELDNIISQGYEIFRKYTVSIPLDACTNCCITKEQEDALAFLQVNVIDMELLQAYRHAAKPAVPDITEYKHFLPRMLDLSAQFHFPSHSTEITLDGIALYNREEWTTAEYALLEAFAVQFFKRCLSVYPLLSFSDRIDTILIMFWRAKLSIKPLLKLWETYDTPEGTMHFKDLMLHSAAEHNSNKMWNSFADTQLFSMLKNWMLSPTVKNAFADRIEQCVLESNDLDDKDAAELSWCYELLKV